MNPVLQTTFTLRVCFPEMPSRHIRTMLRQAGFRYTGSHWHLTTGTASPIGNAQLEDILGLHIEKNRNSGIAPTN
ncbi:hypothetical protein TA3x_000389 [Tundrisphaera sp. TA3]|uniref:hypothetical protein n=1 Tax=Tundrisphaera sp. TA3 TaxID=3435775 RepID=UPI003EBE2FAA